jgi:nitroreductase
MELYDVMRTTFACREFTGDPVPDEILHRIIDNARFAPSGGNRQGWRIISITDTNTREALADLSLPCATRYLLELQAGESPLNTVVPSAITDADVAAADQPGWLVAHIRNAPTLLVVTVDLALVASMDKDLPRVGLISGGSIYPLAWNILLAARNEGYGGISHRLQLAVRFFAKLIGESLKPFVDIFVKKVATPIISFTTDESAPPRCSA